MDHGHLPPKAYENLEFLHSPMAREVRILAEFLEPRHRLRRHGVHGTVVFFGSARIPCPGEEPEGTSEGLRAMGVWYERARELARKLSVWSREGSHGLTVCSGGGHGIMGAANRGAHDAGAPSVGFNISLPFEQLPNPWITPELSFQFHYFFLRKYWFAYSARAMVVFPGGFGTLDEMMEVLTLVQTRKIDRPLPIVLFGKSFWEKILDIGELERTGMISPGDTSLWFWAETVEDAFSYLTSELRNLRLRTPDVGPSAVPPS